MKKIEILILLCTLFLISCSKKSETINNISQVDGKRICVLPGSAGDIAARKAFPNSKFMVFEGSVDASLAVKSGKADAFVYDKSVLIKIKEKNPDLKILDEPVSKLDVAIAIGKMNSELLASLDKVLADLRTEGILDSLKKKWVDTEYQSVPQIAEIKNENSNGSIKMGTSAIYEPFTFLSHGEFTGMDIELVKMIGARLNKKIEIINMNFDGLIPSLLSGKIDIALSNFNVTEERKKIINYSLPYLSNDISVLVRK